MIIAEFISFEGCFKPGLAFQVRHLYGTICPLILIYILHYQYLVGHDRLSYGRSDLTNDRYKSYDSSSNYTDLLKINLKYHEQCFSKSFTIFSVDW